MEFDLIYNNAKLFSFIKPNEQEAIKYIHTLFTENTHPIVKNKDIKKCKLRKINLVFEYIDL